MDDAAILSMIKRQNSELRSIVSLNIAESRLRVSYILERHLTHTCGAICSRQQRRTELDSEKLKLLRRIDSRENAFQPQEWDKVKQEASFVLE